MVGHIVGHKKEHAFEEADVLVVPSYTENFGIVVTEALARGIPVIASTGTPWQKLEEVGCGLWVANDPKSLATAIETMNQLPLKQLGEKGRAWMQKEFDWGYRTQQILSYYRQLVAEKSL
jgi:glycosyltransferase involved in cell wall biosynthesis